MGVFPNASFCSIQAREGTHKGRRWRRLTGVGFDSRLPRLTQATRRQRSRVATRRHAIVACESERTKVATRRHAIAMGANPWWACEPDGPRVAKRRHALIDAEKHCRPHAQPNQRPTTNSRPTLPFSCSAPARGLLPSRCDSWIIRRRVSHGLTSAAGTSRRFATGTPIAEKMLGLFVFSPFSPFHRSLRSRNRTGIEDIGLDTRKLNTPGQAPFSDKD
jgi:hypothetical protein